MDKKRWTAMNSLLLVVITLCVGTSISNVVTQYNRIDQQQRAFSDLETINEYLKKYPDIQPLESIDEIFIMLPDLPSDYYASYQGSLCEYYAKLRCISQEYHIPCFPSVTAYAEIPLFCEKLEAAIEYASMMGLPKVEFSYRIQLYLAMKSDDFTRILDVPTLEMIQKQEEVRLWGAPIPEESDS